MLIEIYLALLGVASLFAVIASLQYTISSTQGRVKVNVFLSWFSAIMFLVLSLSSGNVQYQHCDTPVDYVNTSQQNISNNSYVISGDQGMKYAAPFTCTTYSVEQVGLIWLFGGVGVIMLLFAIINTIELIPGLLQV